MPLAMIFSLPRVAFFWSLVLFVAQALIIFFFAVPLAVGIAVCVVVPMLALCIVWLLFPVQRSNLYRRFLGYFSFSWLRVPLERQYERIPDAERCEEKALD